MARIIHRQWYEENSDSKYPFADSATLLSKEGQALSKETFVDASIYPIGGDIEMFLSSIVVDSDSVTIYIGTINNQQLCFGVFDPLNPPMAVRLEDSYGRAAGVLVVEGVRLAEFQSWPVGTYTFDETDTPFAASVCVPTPEIGLRGFITEAGDLFTGDVWLVGEYGVVLSEDTTEAQDGIRVVRIDVVGDPLFKQVLCEGTAQTQFGPIDLFPGTSYLKTINGIAPDAYGDWKITAGGHVNADTILRIYPTAEGIKFEVVGEKAVG